MKRKLMSSAMERFLLHGGAVLMMGASVAVSADVMEPKVAGSDFSVPSTIGTFSYSLPVGSVIDRVILFSPMYSYTAGPGFILRWNIDDVPTLSLPLGPDSGTFFMGSVVWNQSDGPGALYDQIADGSVALSVSCEQGSECPTGFYRQDAQDWRLRIEYTRKVDIDIRPGTMPNPLNLRSDGVVPVAVLSDSEFDALSVDRDSLTFGRFGTEASLVKCNAQPEDVNADGLLDLVCHFSTAAAGFVRADMHGVLMGVIEGGGNIKGADSVRVVP